MNYPKLIFFFASLLILNSLSLAQSKDEKIGGIRVEFQKINRDSSLLVITIDDPEEFLGHATDGGGELTGYFKKDSIHKIAVTVGLSYGEIHDEYYFKNEKLIFVFETEKHFSYDSSGVNHEKLTLAFEGRYYFSNDKLINKVEKGTRRFDDKNNKAQLFPADAKQYMSLLKSRKK